MPFDQGYNDAFPTKYTFANGVTLFETEVTPPGWDGGEAINATTMRSTGGYEQMAPRTLKKMSEGSLVCKYKVANLAAIVAQINVNQLITVTYPDNSTIVFWGWIRTFTPNAHKPGEPATANVAITPSLSDANGNPVSPVITG